VQREDGVARNQRLTATTAVVLIVLLALEGVTILAIEPLLSWHIVVGLLLIPPVALKLAATGYRMLRYYRRSPAYALRGAPPLLLRALAPVVVASTVAVFTTGVALLLAGPDHERLVGLHKLSFVVWLAATGPHVLAHLSKLPRLVLAPGLVRRVALVGASVLAGGVLALGTVSATGGWQRWLDRDDAAAAAAWR
jgi:hypothetical protein